MSGIDTNNGVGIVLIDSHGRFLLQLRDDIEGIAWPGMWGLVGGAMEEGELPYDAAVREAEEEIGQRLDRLHLIGSLPAMWSDGGTLHLFCAGAGLADADIIVGEGQAARFFDPSDILSLEGTTPYIKPLVSGFISDLRYEQCMREAALAGQPHDADGRLDPK